MYMYLCVISEVVSLLLNFMTLTMNDTITTSASLYGGSWLEAVQSHLGSKALAKLYQLQTAEESQTLTTMSLKSKTKLHSATLNSSLIKMKRPLFL